MEQKRNALQEHIFDIFLEINKVCEKYQISYFIMGGTALGAVRHGGFIPWDDDLDIGMLREDYDRFLAMAPEALREDLFLQTYQSEEKSPFYFAKVRKDNTSFLEYYCRNLKIHEGIYVDIFPYDRIPDGKWARRRYYRESKILLNLYIAKCVTGTSVRYKGIKYLCYMFLRGTLHVLLAPVPKQVLFGMVDRRMRKHNEEDTAYVGYGGLPKIQVRRVDVEHPARIAFEGMMVKCPAHVERYLCDNFGDYWKLPPEEERRGHKPYRVKI